MICQPVVFPGKRALWWHKDIQDCTSSLTSVMNAMAQFKVALRRYILAQGKMM